MPETQRSIEQMPVLNVGRGTPMNAIEDNEFSRGWRTRWMIPAVGRLERCRSGSVNVHIR